MFLAGQNLNLRYVEEADANFIASLKLQSNTENTAVSEEEVSLTLQQIQKYKQKEGSLEHFFIVEDKSGNLKGIIKIYDTKGNYFSWSNEFLSSSLSSGIFLEAAVLMYELAFFKLGFQKTRFEVSKSRGQDIFIHKKMGAVIVKEDCQNYYFCFDKNSYRNYIVKEGKAFGIEHQAYQANKTQNENIPKGKVLILIINSDNSKNLEACKNNIKEQDYKDIEIMTIETSEDNKISAQINEFLKDNFSEYVIFFDSDNLMLPGMLSKQIKALSIDKFAPICFADCLLSGSRNDKHYYGIFSAPQSFDNLLSDDNINLSSAMIRRSMLPKEGIAEDFNQLWGYKLKLDLFKTGRWIYLNEPLLIISNIKEEICSSERFKLYERLKVEIQGHQISLKFNQAVCYYDKIIEEISKGNIKEGLLLLKNIYPYCFLSLKWLSRLKTILITLIKNRIKK